MFLIYCYQQFVDALYIFKVLCNVKGGFNMKFKIVNCKKIEAKDKKFNIVTLIDDDGNVSKTFVKDVDYPKCLNYDCRDVTQFVTFRYYKGTYVPNLKFN